MSNTPLLNVNDPTKEYYKTVLGNPAIAESGMPDDVRNMTVFIEPTQSGSGDPSPTNIRPISGVSSVSVTRSGKNLAKITTSSTTKSGVTFTVNNNAGTINVNGSPVDSYAIWFEFGNVTLLPGNYILSGGASSNCLVQLEIAGGTVVQHSGYSGTAFTVHSTATGAMYIRAQGSQTNNTLHPMIHFAGMNGMFEPYQGQTVTVQLTDGSNPLTVYGGTLNVITGELTVTYVSTVITSSADMVYYAGNSGSVNYLPTGLNTMAPGSWTNDSATGCDTLPKSNGVVPGQAVIRFGANNSYIYFYGVGNLDGVSDAASWNAWLATHKPQIVYPLATPLTYQLTPQQLSSLEGINNFTSSNGQVAVTYRINPSGIALPE